MDHHQVERQETCASQLHETFPVLAALCEEKPPRDWKAGPTDCWFNQSCRRTQ